MNLDPEPGSPSSSAVDRKPIRIRPGWLWLVMAAALSAFAFWGIPKVPFHPDEATYLFMSEDLETLFRDPLSLAWDPEVEPDLRGHYRLVDAPLTRYLLGVGRLLAGLPAPQADWDWTLTWSENRAAGVLPEERLLNSGRAMMTLLIPLDLLLIYWLGRRLGGGACGLLAALFFGLNSLVLLHGRRSMAEGLLVFGILISLWSFISGYRRGWLVGLAVAITLNAKHTGAAFIPVGLLALVLPALLADKGTSRNEQRSRWRIWLGTWMIYGLVLVCITLILNPVFWKHPIQALLAAQTERMELVQNQTETQGLLSPETALNSDPRRLATLIANLYMTPPVFAEAANYLPQTALAQRAYLEVPGHNLGRGFLLGGLAFALTLFGMALAVMRLKRMQAEQRQSVLILLAATTCLGAGIYWLVPLPFQRYIMPLVPLTCLWSAYGLTFWVLRKNKTT